LNRIHNLDCIEGMDRIPDCSIDMILSDLPYDGMTENHWDSAIHLEDLWRQFERVAKPHAAIVLTAASPFSHVLAKSKLEWLRTEWVWLKEQGTNFLNVSTQPLRSHETVLVFAKTKT